MQVYELEALSEGDLREILDRGALALGVVIDDDVAGLIARRAGGDARSGLSILELAAQTALAENAAVSAAHIEDAARKRPLAYDRAGDAHYDTISAWIKATRASDVQASIYYLAAMLEGGEDARFIARRMIVLASEDIGNADPRALMVAVAAAQAVEHVGLPEARLNLAQAAIYLARAPKSNASYSALNAATAELREHGSRRPPEELRPQARVGSPEETYRYPHADPEGFAVDCLPDGLKGAVFYTPSGIGEEIDRARGGSASQPPPPAAPPDAANPERSG
jgi:putative ATPase